MSRRLLPLVLLLAGCSLPPLAVAGRDGAVDAGADAREAGASDSLSPDSRYTWPARWHVSRGFIRDAQGRALLMRGMSLAGSHKQPPCFGFHTEADFKRLSAQWGMNISNLKPFDTRGECPVPCAWIVKKG